MATLGVISSVTTQTNKTKVQPNEPILVTVTAHFSSPTTTYGYVTFALAVNSANNIVSTATESVPPGSSQISHTFTISFSREGTYTIYGGGRWSLLPPV